MKCPYCGELNTGVRWTKVPKKSPGQVHRGRRCEKCHRDFTTAEVVRGVEVNGGEFSGGSSMSAGFSADARYNRTDRERVERAARIYNSNRDAGLALGITPGSFGRLCRRYGIETPKVRRKKLATEVK